MRATGVKSPKRREGKLSRFRFSMRSLLSFFLVVAILSGMVGRTVTIFLTEKRLADRLEEMGATTAMSVVPPKGPIQQGLYIVGFRSVFKRLISIDLSWLHSVGSKAPYVLSDRDAEAIGNLRSLRVLNLKNSGVTDQQLAEVASCTSLRILVLKDNAVSDVGVNHFVRHPELSKLDVAGCNITNPVLKKVLNSLPKREGNAYNLITQRAKEECVRGGFRIVGGAPAGWLTIVARVPDLSRLDYALPAGTIRTSKVNVLSMTPSIVQQLALHKDRFRHLGLNTENSISDFIPKLDWFESVETHGPGNLKIDAFENWDQLRELSLSEVSTIYDDDMEILAELPRLKVLRIPRSAITTVGLQELIDSDLELEEIGLPWTFAEFSNLITQSGLAKKVNFARRLDEFDPDGSRRRIQVLFPRISSFEFSELLIKSLEKSISRATFPAPKASPVRPEDRMQLALRRSLVAVGSRLKTHDPARAIELLERAVDDFEGSDISLEDLMAIEHELEPLQRRSPQSPARNPNDVAFQNLLEIGKAFHQLALLHEAEEQFDAALEMRVRQFACSTRSPFTADLLPSDDDLAKLCQRASDEVRPLKEYFFLWASERENQWEASPRIRAHSIQSRPAAVAIAGGKERQISFVNGKGDGLKIYTNDGEVTSDGKRFEIPPGVRVIYVSPTSFPLTVETEPYVFASDRRTDDEILLFGDENAE